MDEGGHKRWQLSFECRALWLEERGDKERMLIQLYGTYFTRSIVCRRTKWPRDERCLKRWIQAIATAIPFRSLPAAIGMGDARVGEEAHSACGLYQRARKWRNDRANRIGGCFCMLGVCPPQDVTRVLNDGVLKPAARPEEWATIFACVLNGKQCAFHVAIGTRWYTPQPVERRDTRNIADFLCENPLQLDFHRSGIGGKLQGDRYGLMRGYRRVVIANEADENALLHSSLLS